MARASKRAKQEVQPQTNILTQDELIKVETSPLEVENAKLLMAVEEQALANMMLEFKLLEQKIEKQRIRVAECHGKYTSAREKHSAVIGQIMLNHNLPNDKFSYNPNTGEILT